MVLRESVIMLVLSSVIMLVLARKSYITASTLTLCLTLFFPAIHWLLYLFLEDETRGAS